MLISELFQEAKSASAEEKLTKKLGQKTNKYRQFKNDPTLRGVQRAENAIVKSLGESALDPALVKLEDELQYDKDGRHADFTHEGEYLVVRHYGQWEGDDGSGDYDHQTLSSVTRDKVRKIITDIEKKHKVKISVSTGEKNYIYFKISK